MEPMIGSLETGKRADLIIVSTGAARQTPIYDPVSHLVYVTRGDDVRTTIVNGKVLMRDRRVRTLDRAAVIADANRMAAKVRSGEMRRVESQMVDAIRSADSAELRCDHEPINAM